MSCHLVAQMSKMMPAFYVRKWNLLVLFSSTLIGLLVAAVRDSIMSTVLAVMLNSSSHLCEE